MISRRARLVLVLVVLGVVGVGVFAWKPLYVWVMTKRVWMESTLHDDIQRPRGWKHVKRWGTGRLCES